MVLRTWAGCRGEAGLAHLPDAGGFNDQCAWVLEAFDVLAAAEAELSKDGSDR